MVVAMGALLRIVSCVQFWDVIPLVGNAPFFSASIILADWYTP
jgi:hypothetical protein